MRAAGNAACARSYRLADAGKALVVMSAHTVTESLPQCLVRCATDAVLNAAERSPEGQGVAVIDTIDRVTDWDWQMRNGRVPS